MELINVICLIISAQDFELSFVERCTGFTGSFAHYFNVVYLLEPASWSSIVVSFYSDLVQAGADIMAGVVVPDGDMLLDGSCQNQVPEISSTSGEEEPVDNRPPASSGGPVQVDEISRTT